MSGVSTDIAPLVVVMGVSGSGKTTIGTLVAHELGVDFVDGDSLHPIENVQKMASGTPLDDDDRWPWLENSSVDHVVYSSCNATTLARDLGRMPSLRPVEARLLDMFPHTGHYEVAVLLRRG